MLQEGSVARLPFLFGSLSLDLIGLQNHEHMRYVSIKLKQMDSLITASSKLQAH